MVLWWQDFLFKVQHYQKSVSRKYLTINLIFLFRLQDALTDHKTVKTKVMTVTETLVDGKVVSSSTETQNLWRPEATTWYCRCIITLTYDWPKLILFSKFYFPLSHTALTDAAISLTSCSTTGWLKTKLDQGKTESSFIYFIMTYLCVCVSTCRCLQKFGIGELGAFSETN